MTFTSHSSSETLAWAEQFAKTLVPGSIVALFGDLGAGKTVIAKGIGKGLGVTDDVISPTFNYILEYNGRLPLFHADLYRIEGSVSFEAMGFDEYFDRGGVFLIEWAERVRDLLPPDCICVEIVSGPGTSDRTIIVTEGKT
jgi:tRNA threonylcarbamoyladenosine biosynthesis protein TsaE